MFLTLSVSTLGVIAFNVVVQPLSFWLLLIFGHGYAREASTVLRLLSLVGFPYVIKNHYVALCRARGKLLSAAGILSGSAAIELLFAVIGGVLWGVNGVAAGWASAVAVEAVLMTKPVIQATQWPTIRHR
jgi:O-antigen/teichoic acid export membrane protein